MSHSEERKIEHEERKILRDDQKIIKLLEEGLELQREDLHLQRDTIKLQLETLRQIHRLTHPHPRTTKAAVTFGDITMAAAAGAQAVGSTITAVFQPLEADGVTITPGSSLTTPPVWSSDNAAVATVDPSTGVVTGVGAGTANITGTGGVFTDADGVATAPLNASNSDIVTQPTGRTVSAQVAFQ
jgi:Bacterial Ig-like domain (group 2)